MRICLVSSFFEPVTMGGLDVYLQQLAEKLSKNHEVLIVATCPYSGWGSLKASATEKTGSLKVARFFPLNVYCPDTSRRRPFWLRVSWNLINLWNPHSFAIVSRLLKREKPDIIHTHAVRALSPSVISAAGMSGIPHLHTLHNYELISPLSVYRQEDNKAPRRWLDNPYLRLMRSITRSITTVTAGSRFVLDLHATYGLFKNAQQEVLPVLSGVPHDRKTVKDDTTIDILFVGEISPHKGILVLLEAFALLKEGNLRLHIVGQGPCARQVTEYAARDNRVRYHGYLAPGETLWQLYAAANMLVFPSVWLEAQGIVSIEAFSFGTHVIASAIGGIPETVKHGDNGLLVAPGDASGLAEAMRMVTSDKALRRQLEANALKSAKDYEMGSHVERLMRIYQEVR